MINYFFQVDESVLHYLYSIRSVPLTHFFLGVSEFGTWQLVLAIVILISFFLAYRKNYADMIGLWATFFGSASVILFLKYVIARPRPDLVYQAYVEGPFYSFPSAHSGLSMAFYGYCVYLLLQSASTRLRRFLIAFFPILIFLVGFSRLYLGVHYLSDVLAGFAIGGLFVYFGMKMRLRLLK